MRPSRLALASAFLVRVELSQAPFATQTHCPTNAESVGPAHATSFLRPPLTHCPPALIRRLGAHKPNCPKFACECPSWRGHVAEIAPSVTSAPETTTTHRSQSDESGLREQGVRHLHTWLSPGYSRRRSTPVLGPFLPPPKRPPPPRHATRCQLAPALPLNPEHTSRMAGDAAEATGVR